MALPNLSSDNFTTVEDAFFRWCSQKTRRHLSLQITGKAGVGKTRLVNALLGKQVAVEKQAKGICTSIDTPYSIDMDGIEVCVWESLGKQEGSSDEHLTNKVHHGMDVMIYCLKMDERRFHEDDKCAMRELTEAFGEDVWKNAVIALTFANNVKDPDGISKEDKLKYFECDLENWRKAIEAFLADDLNINSELIQAIPIVPTGNYRKLHLPNCENWLSQIWIQCFCVMKDSAALNFYRINKERVKFPGSDKMAAACGSPENETRRPFSSTADTCHETNPTNIPIEIPLGERQLDSFWRKTWKMFTEFYARVESAIQSAASSVGQKILQMFVNRLEDTQK